MSAPAQLDSSSRRRFRAALLRWFDAERRDLPWRRTRDPYRIWVSEIMLQQTRVGAVLEHYGEFLRRFPDVQSLAAAPESAVLGAWSGLGYYRRARALHQAAQVVLNDGGQLPTSAAAWLQLPGIGRYTAAAIASIALGEPCAVVDGNVERVLRRVFAHTNGTAARLWQVAGELLSRARPGDFNQAMMELGATVCLPQQPLCVNCPVENWCAVRGPLPTAPQTARRRQEIAYGLALRRQSVYLVQRRASASLMPSMWELPEIQPPASAPAFTLRHAITVTDYRVRVYHATRVAGGRWILVTRLPSLPLTGLARKILRRAGII